MHRKRHSISSIINQWRENNGRHQRHHGNDQAALKNQRHQRSESIISKTAGGAGMAEAKKRSMASAREKKKSRASENNKRGTAAAACAVASAQHQSAIKRKCVSSMARIGSKYRRHRQKARKHQSWRSSSGGGSGVCHRSGIKLKAASK